MPLLAPDVVRSAVPRQRRKGKVRKIEGVGAVKAREHYLRTPETLLVECFPSTPQQVVPGYVVPDAGVLKRYFDLFEDAAFAAGQTLLLLQTVLDQVSVTLSQRQQRRLQGICRGHAGGWAGGLLFLNEHCPDTYVGSGGNRTRQARDASAVVAAYSYCQQRLCVSTSGDGRTGLPQVTLLTEQPALYSTDVSCCVRVLDVASYVDDVCPPADRQRLRQLVDATAAADSAAAAATAAAAAAALCPMPGPTGLSLAVSAPRGVRGTMDDFAPHLNEAAVAAGLASGTLLSGTVSVFAHNPREATVLVSTSGDGWQRVGKQGFRGSGGGDGGGAGASAAGGRRAKVLLAGRHAFNRAIHGDIVAVRLLPPSLWRAPTDAGRLTYAPFADVDSSDPADADPDAIVAAESSSSLAETAGRAPAAARTLPRGALPTGVVVGVVRRAYRPFVATIPPDESARRGVAGGEGAVLAVPMDPRLPKVRLRTRQLALLTGRRLVVRMDDWPADTHYPNGHYVRTLGPVGNLAAEVAAMLVENEAAFEPFSARALACLPAVPHPPPEPQGPEAAARAAEGDAAVGEAGSGGGKGANGSSDGGGVRRPKLFGKAPPWSDSGWRVPAAEAARRRDLRAEGCRVFSVDPSGCQDIDDAMHVRRLPGGSLEVGVHIADVSHFVQHGDPLDREARRRSTSTYLVHRRYDMLPALLSSDICSLHSGVDRLAVSVTWRLPPMKKGAGTGGGVAKDDAEAAAFPYGLPILADGTAAVSFVGRTVIRSCAAMTYDQADELLRTGALSVATTPPPPGQAGASISAKLHAQLAADLWQLTHFARALRRRRDRDGAIDLTTAGGELKFTLDPETGNAMNVSPQEEAEIHRTIAELMILANASVAEIITAAFPTAALLRCHGAPAPERLGSLAEVAAAAGVPAMQGVSGREMQAALRCIGGGGGGSGAREAAEQRDLAGNTPAEALMKSIATRAMAEAQYVCSGSTSDLAAGGGLEDGPSLLGAGDNASPTGAAEEIVEARPAAVTAGTGAGPEAAGGVVRAGALAAGAQRFSHYGLALRWYTHFTSPIRRYADVIVHRLLLTALAKNVAAAAGVGSLEEGADGGNCTLVAALGRGPGVAIPPSLTPSVMAAGRALRGSSETEKEMKSVKLTINPDGTCAYNKVAMVPAGGRRGSGGANAAGGGSGGDDLDDGDTLLDALLGLDVDEDDDDGGALLGGGSGGGGSGGGGDKPTNSWAAKALLAGGCSDETPALNDAPVEADRVLTLRDGGVGSGDGRAGGSVEANGGLEPPFSGPELEKICEHLNERHRIAKRLSSQCQELFLRLFFARHAVVTPAVVVSLRANGVMAYLPSFDLRGPVYLCDRDGTVQVDPALVGLPPDAGNATSAAFAAFDRCRALPGWSLRLDEGVDAMAAAAAAVAAVSGAGGNDTSAAVTTAAATAAATTPAAGSLLVVPPPGDAKGRQLQLSVLGVLSVRVSCDVLPSHVRLPRLRLNLIAAAPPARRRGKGSDGGGSTSVEVNSEVGSSSGRNGRSKVKPKDGSARIGGGDEEDGRVKLARAKMGEEDAPATSIACAEPRGLYTSLQRLRNAAVAEKLPQDIKIVGQQPSADANMPVPATKTLARRGAGWRPAAKLCEERVERARGRVSFGGFELAESHTTSILNEFQYLYDDCREEVVGGDGWRGQEGDGGGGGSSALSSLNEYGRETMARTQRLRAEKRHYKKIK